jgi:hypothetical protein
VAEEAIQTLLRGDAVYIVAAVAMAGWLIRDLHPESILGAVVISVPIAAGASAYGRRLTVGH